MQKKEKVKSISERKITNCVAGIKYCTEARFMIVLLNTVKLICYEFLKALMTFVNVPTVL